MRVGLYSVVAGALLIGSAVCAGAQEAVTPAEPAGNADFAAVIGISNGDLLNIRAAASPTGIVIARVPNGTLLKVAGCSATGKSLWCRVEDANDPAATGWTPARYLAGYEDRALDVAAGGAAKPDEDTSIMSGNATFGTAAAKPQADARGRGVVASFYNEPLPPGTAAPGVEATREVRANEPVARDIIGGPAVAPLIVLPVVPGEGTDLAPARRAEAAAPAPSEQAEPEATAAAEPPSVPETDKPTDVAPAQGYSVIEPKKVTVSKVPAQAADLPKPAEQETAALSETQASVETQDPVLAPEPAPALPAKPEPQAAAEPPLAVAKAPVDAASVETVPDAGPSEEKSALQSIAEAFRALVGGEEETTEEVAAAAPATANDNDPAVPVIVEPPVVAAIVPATTGSTGEIGGEIPCARYLGQPMVMCRASVVREGAQAAAVTVSWPDGGRRVIRFKGGEMSGSDTTQPFRAVREADLNMIRIGKTERFEITDALVFGG